MHSSHGTGYTVVGTHRGAIGGATEDALDTFKQLFLFKAQDKTQESNDVAFTCYMQYSSCAMDFSGYAQTKVKQIFIKLLLQNINFGVTLVQKNVSFIPYM